MQGWFGQDESAGQRFGTAVWRQGLEQARPRAMEPGFGQFCVSVLDRQRLPGSPATARERRCTEGGRCREFYRSGNPLSHRQGEIAPWNTPIECLTVVDLVRMTLGVGPCQYILDLEGQKRGSRGVATCYRGT